MSAVRWVILVASAVLLGVVVGTVGLDQLYRDALQVGWGIVPYIALTGIQNLFHTLSQRCCFAREHRGAVPLWRLYLIAQSGHAINHLTPTAEIGGDVARGLVLDRYLPGSEAASAILVNKFTYSIARMIAAAALIAVTLVVFPIGGATLWLLALGSGLTTLALLAFAYVQARGSFGTTLERLARIAGPSAREWVRDNVGEIDRRLRRYYREHRADLATAILCDLGGFAVGVVQKTYLMALLLDTTPPLPTLLAMGAAVWGITTLLEMIFFFVTADLGVHEGGHKLAFEIVGLAGAKGVALGIIDRIDQIIWAAIGVGAYWAEVSSRHRPAAGKAGPGPR